MLGVSARNADASMITGCLVALPVMIKGFIAIHLRSKALIQNLQSFSIIKPICGQKAGKLPVIIAFTKKTVIARTSEIQNGIASGKSSKRVNAEPAAVWQKGKI